MLDLPLLDPTVFYPPIMASLPDAQFVRDLVHHIDGNALLYLAAATVARFWHEHMWMVYVAMAYTTVLGLHN
jgi:hypothetical protein